MNSIRLPTSPKVKKTKFKGSPSYNLKVMKYLKNKNKDFGEFMIKSNITFLFGLLFYLKANFYLCMIILICLS